MTARPSAFPNWAMLDETSEQSGQPNVATPPTAYQNYGWSYQEKPPRQFFNWLGRTTSNWLHYLDEQTAYGKVRFIASADASEESQNMASVVCGAREDQQDINNAIDEVSAAGGGIVVLSEGTFYVDDSIVLKSNVQLVGRGGPALGATKILVDPITNTSFAIVSASGVTNVGLADLIIDGNKNNIGAYEHDGVNLGSVSSVRVERVAAKNTNGIADRGYGFIWSGTYGVFKQCAAVSCDASGMTADTGADYASLLGCMAVGCGATGIGVAASDVLVDQCLAVGNHNGIYVTGARAQIVRNRIADDQNHGIVLDGAVDGMISGNMIYNCSQASSLGYSGIYATDGSGCSITGNTIRKGASVFHQYGVNFASGGSAPASFVVSGNDLYNSGGTAPLNPSTVEGYAITFPFYVWDGAAHVAHSPTNANRVS